MKSYALKDRVDEILEMREQDYTLEAIAERMGCHLSSIAAICSGEAYASEKAHRPDDRRDRRCGDCFRVYTRFHTSGVPWREYYRCAACAAGKWYREQMERFGRVLH